MCSRLATRFLGWCHKISSMSDRTLTPSQNRTGAVNASGSQLTRVTNLSHSPAQRDQIRQLPRSGQLVAINVSVKLRPVHRPRLRAAIQPAEGQPLRHPAELHQPRPIVIDPVVLIVAPQLRIAGYGLSKKFSFVGCRMVITASSRVKYLGGRRKRIGTTPFGSLRSLRSI